MSKNILSLFLLVLCSYGTTVRSQNYQNICLPGITFYKDSGGKFSAFRRDSVNIQGNNDSVFFSYRTIKDTSEFLGYCKDTTNGSILGRKVLKKSDGWFYFFNRFQDSVRINTQASINQSWKFFDLLSGSYIEAQVILIDFDSILGVPDQTKIIRLQAKNFSNNNIPHILNGKIISLSQHFGLSKMLNVYYFPSDTVLYTLSGLSELNLGDQDLTWQEVYDFEIGDEFHFYADWWTSLGSSYQVFTIKNILDKTVYGNIDSVSYQVELCYRKITYSSPYPPSYINFYDTITKTYNFHQLSEDDPLRLPEEFVSSWDLDYGPDPPLYSAMDNSINNHKGKGKITGWTEYDYSEHCYTAPFESFYTDNRYTSGLGHTQDYYQYWSDGLFTYNETLVYYKKGTEVWGEPVSTDCSVLTSVEDIKISDKIRLEVIPNPAETQVIIKIFGEENTTHFHYSLYNSAGVKEIEGVSGSQSFDIKRNGLPSGLYFLILADPQGCLIGRTKILFR